MKALLQNLALGLITILLSLAMLEAGLRFVYPRYQYAADAAYAPDDLRIFSNKPNGRYIRPHPDDGTRHNVIYNNRALRLHRDINDDELKSRKVIAIFGDSFTENPRLRVDRVFTEQLDYLLNLNGPFVSVLNFGTDGYGLDQELEYYRAAAIAQNAAEVLYVFCANDLRNVIENGIFSLDDNGKLKRNALSASGPLLRLVSRLHLTYLVLESRAVLLARISGEARSTQITARDLAESAQFKARGERLEQSSGDANRIERAFLAGNWSDIAPALNLFRAIVRTFADAVASNGGHFAVALLPRPEEHSAATLFDGLEVERLDLFDAFRTDDPAYDFAQTRFRNDGHWNEAGNRMAAIALYRAYAAKLGLTPLPKAEIDAALAAYDRAFTGADDAASRAIRARYQALDDRYPPVQ